MIFFADHGAVVAVDVAQDSKGRSRVRLTIPSALVELLLMPNEAEPFELAVRAARLSADGRNVER